MAKTTTPPTGERDEATGGDPPIAHSLAASTKRAKDAMVSAGLQHHANPDAVPPVIIQPESALPQGYPVFAIRGLFLIALVGSLYFAKDFFLPVAVAVVLALTLSPLVRFLSRRGVPAPVSGVSIVILMFVVTLTGIYTLAVPVSDMVARAPEIGTQLEEKLSVLRRPFQAMKDAEAQIDEVGTDDTAVDEVQKVTVQGPGLVTSAASTIVTILTSITVTAVLLAFLLSSGDMFYAKLVRVYDTLADKKRALRIAHDVERVVSRYLFTITMINIGLGIAVGTGLWLLGMPVAYLWGMVATVVNFIPYVGSLIGIAAATAVAVVSFDQLGSALAITGFYFVCTFLEGQVITPLILGRRLELNTVAVFLAIGFGAWLWGVVGALIAVPMLVIIKTVCDHFEGLETLGDFLSGDRSVEKETTSDSPG